MANPKGKPIVIFGMHRSGTSVIASMLHRVGISMGQDFLDPDGHNPQGYFEDTDFLWLNKGIIENSGGTWYTPPTVSEMQEGGKKFDEAAKKIMTAKRKIAGQNSWGWKDPRNCLTCWTYAKYVSDAKFIIVVRDFKSIKRSLNAAHGHLANWDTIISAYYDSIEEFLRTNFNDSLNVCFEELVYEEYTRNAVTEILDFVEKPERLVDKAMSVIRSR